MTFRRYHVIQPLAVAAALVAIAAPAQAGRHSAALKPHVFTDPAVVARHRALARLGEPQVIVDRSDPSAIERLLLQERGRGGDICGGSPSCLAGFGGFSAPSVTIVEPSAFDWGDAGVGAAGAFGLMLLASGLVIVSRTQRPRLDVK
jgi:hypothetical protein